MSDGSCENEVRDLEKDMENRVSVFVASVDVYLPLFEEHFGNFIVTISYRRDQQRISCDVRMVQASS